MWLVLCGTLCTLWIGVLVVHWVGGKGEGPKTARGGGEAHDATVTMTPFWNCRTHWQHDFGG